MRRTPRSAPSLRAAAAVAAALTVAGGVALPSTADAAGASGPTQRVTLVLAPKDRGALRALAAQGKASPAALKAAIPTARTRETVSATLQRLGYTVLRSTPFTVEVAAPASRIRGGFGSARAGTTAARPLPTVPAALRSLVTVAFGGDETRPAFHRLLTGRPGGSTGDPGEPLRSSYGVSAPLPASSPGVAVATIQLSDWDARDLTTYASQHNGPAPQLTQIDDTGYPAELNPSDSLEVDLDQQAIYAVAPNARQRLYKSANLFEGMYSSLIHLADDALNGADDNIAAASISWGFCESAIGSGPAANQLYTAFEDALSYVLSAGVTVFAASGDDGTKCTGFDEDGNPVQSSSPDVSYPASSPQIVAVGGTSGYTAGDDLTSWDETSGGSGGGQSSVFRRPAWQTDAIVGSATAQRALPDIAALAGPPGFEVYSSTAYTSPGYDTVGGTSLAAPVAATGLATALAAAQHPYGIGALSPDLYAAYGRGGTPVTTDVTTSGDAADATPGQGVAAPAGPGYDFSTGLGAPRWEQVVAAIPGTPHITPLRYTRSTTIPYTVTKSLAATGDASVRYRVEDATFASPGCSVALGAQPSSPNSSSRTFTGSYDVTFGAGYDYSSGTGEYDGVYTFAVVEQQGGACRVGLRNAVVDTLPPSVGRPTFSVSRGARNSQLTASWSSSDELSGAGSFSVVVIRATRSNKYSYPAVRTTGSSYSFDASPGYLYAVQVTPTDRAGNIGSAFGSKWTNVYDDRDFSFSTGWSTAASGSDFRGSSRSTSRAGATATRTIGGKSYYLVTRTGPAYGKVSVSVGGVSKTIDLYSPSLKQRVSFLVYSSSTSPNRSVVVKALGQRNPNSGGTTVVLDGLLAVY